MSHKVYYVIAIVNQKTLAFLLAMYKLQNNKFCSVLSKLMSHESETIMNYHESQIMIH